MSLTKIQKELFDDMEQPYDQEESWKSDHAFARDYMGGPKSFTYYLKREVKKYWRRQHDKGKIPYLGD